MGWSRGATIGFGSSATVSLATVHDSGEIFAVKSAELIKSKPLQREQKILSTMNSPHIVTYKGWNISSENGKLIYNLSMEYAAAGSLSETISQTCGGINETTIKSHTRDILFGLDYLHSNGIVHCDIKGRNILVTDTGAKIADLGCAKNAEAPDASPISGTPMFMAPEVARGEDQGFAADVWALGCVVIEMATGGQPWFDMFDPIRALYRIGFTTYVPEIPSFLSDECKDFISKCLKRNPLERWSVTELINHEFVKNPTFLAKENDQLETETPTSVLDNGLWDSGEDEYENYPSLTREGEKDSQEERIRNLCEGNMASFWEIDDWASDENWVTVRENCNREPNRPSLNLDNEPTNMSSEDTIWFSQWNTRLAYPVEFSISSVLGNFNIEKSNSNKDSVLKSDSPKSSKCCFTIVVVVPKLYIFCAHLNNGDKELRLSVNARLLYSQRKIPDLYQNLLKSCWPLVTKDFYTEVAKSWVVTTYILKLSSFFFFSIWILLYPSHSKVLRT